MSRLIPAHAGKTLPLDGPDQAVRAHPRSRGENCRTRACKHPQGGSSPLTRGKRCLDCHLNVASGLIPAHAGKTSTGPAGGGAHRAHPRSRGENEDPPVRDDDALRLIPAHAGKTQARPPGVSKNTAHPRSRGENADSIRSISPVGGSSPLTRGKQLFGLPAFPALGLIPAHAGKTCVSLARTVGNWAHPRSRGENVTALGALSPVAGSSPLTRGKPQRPGASGPRRRLIPAHAGKTTPVL